MDCELLDQCPFYNTLSSQAVDVLKEVYCRGNPMVCARRQVAMAIGREKTPLDLAPNHDYRVQEIIEAFLSEQ